MTGKSMSLRKIVILGGSYGGISTAHYLLKHAVLKLPQPQDYQIVLVNPSKDTMCRPACPRAMISDDMFNQAKLFVNIPQQFEQYPKGSFHFVQGTTTGLDHKSRKVTIELPDGTNEEIEYYALIIATGASTPSPLLGPNKGVEHLRQSWAEFRKALPTAKSIVIAGGGPAGVETAGELGEHLNHRAGWFSSKHPNPKVAITVITAGSQILPAPRPSLAQKAEHYLAQVGVTVIKNARVTSVDPPTAGSASVRPTSSTTVTLDNDKTLYADIYIPATGTQPNTAFVDPALLTSDKRVATSASTLRADAAGERVYAIGDAASAARPAVHLTFEAVPVLCANVKRDLLLAAAATAPGEDKIFTEDTRETQMVPIGKSKGVGAAMGWALPSWLVWAIKGRDYWLWTTGALWSGRQWAKEK